MVSSCPSSLPSIERDDPAAFCSIPTHPWEWRRSFSCEDIRVSYSSSTEEDASYSSTVKSWSFYSSSEEQEEDEFLHYYGYEPSKVVVFCVGDGKYVLKLPAKTKVEEDKEKLKMEGWDAYSDIDFKDVVFSPEDVTPEEREGGLKYLMWSINGKFAAQPKKSSLLDGLQTLTSNDSESQFFLDTANLAAEFAVYTYNLRTGSNLELDVIVRANMCRLSYHFFITLDAMDKVDKNCATFETSVVYEGSPAQLFWVYTFRPKNKLTPIPGNDHQLWTAERALFSTLPKSSYE